MSNLACNLKRKDRTHFPSNVEYRCRDLLSVKLLLIRFIKF